MKSIAIIGSAFELPRALSCLDTIANELSERRSQISRIDNSRWNHELIYHPQRTRRGKTYANHMGRLARHPQLFDRHVFGISAREADQMDPQQKILLELTFKALSGTNYTRQKLVGAPISVFIGASSTDLGFVFGQEENVGDAYFMTGTTQSLISNRISHIFGWTGANSAVDTACSSSLVAIDSAVKTLQSGEAEMAVAGGVSILLNPLSFVGFAQANMLSASGACHVFDKKADGYCRGEGAGVILLKDLEAAKRDGDPIQAIIRSVGLSHNGANKLVSFPSSDAQSKLMSEQMKHSGALPEDFAFFEAHGTGTPIGDPVESFAISKAIAQHRSTPLPIGSIKGNIGHLEPASGIAGVGKVLASLKHSKLLPQANFEQPNPDIKFDDLNLRVVEKSEQADFDKTPFIGLNSFGFGGVNGSLVIEAPDSAKSSQSKKSYAAAAPKAKAKRHLLDAHSEAALVARVEQVEQQILDGLDANSNIAATLAARLDGGTHRAVIAGGGDLGTQTIERVEFVSSDKGAVFVFSGNGSQRPGMGRAALLGDDGFRAAFEEVAEHFNVELGFDLTQALISNECEIDLQDTSISQPLLFALQASYVKRLLEDGFSAEAVIGHSVGEVAAAYASGALSLKEACNVVLARSKAQHATKGAGRMFAVIAPSDALDLSVLKTNFDAHLAGYNSPNISAFTVLGEASDFLTYMHEQDLRCIDIEIDYPFHSPGMDAVKSQLGELLAPLRSSAPDIALFSTVTGAKWDEAQLDADYWWENVRQPVHFTQAILCALEEGYRHFIEIGPFPILVRHISDIAKANGFRIAVTQIDSIAPSEAGVNAAQLRQNISKFWAMGAPCDLEKFIGCEPKIHSEIAMPAYPFDRQMHALSFTNNGPIWRTAQRAHPFLGDRHAPNKFLNHIDHIKYPLLADHNVAGRILFAGASIIELMLSAVRIIRHCEEQRTTPIRLSQVQLLRAIEFSEDEHTEIVTELDEHANFISISTRPALSEANLSINASAHLMPPILTSESKWLPEYPAIDGVEEISSEQLYKFTQNADLQYGPQFRCVEKVQLLGEAKVLAQLALPADPLTQERPCQHELAYHPGLMDGAFQAALALVADRQSADQTTYVPQSVASLHFLGNEAAARSALISIVSKTPESILADITLFDDEQQAVIHFEKLRLLPMPSARKPKLDNQSVLKTRWLPVLAATPLTLPKAFEHQQDEMDALCGHIALQQILNLSGADSASEKQLSLDAALAEEKLHQDQLPYILALLARLAGQGLADTLDGNMWRLTPTKSDEEVRACFVASQSSLPSSVFALLSYSLARGEKIWTLDEASQTARLPFIDLIELGAGLEEEAHLLAGAIENWIVSTGMQSRCLIRVFGGRQAYLLGALLGRLRRAGYQNYLELELICADAAEHRAAQQNLAGFFGVEVLQRSDWQANAIADLVIFMPDWNQETEQTPRPSDAFFTQCIAPSAPILSLNMKNSFQRDLILGALPHYWLIDDETGLPVPTSSKKALQSLLQSENVELGEGVPFGAFELAQSTWSDTNRLLPNAITALEMRDLPRSLDAHCSLDLRDKGSYGSAEEIFELVHKLAHCDASELQEFILICALGDAEHEGVAASISALANENSWSNLLTVFAPIGHQLVLPELAQMFGTEQAVRWSSNGWEVLRFVPAELNTDVTDLKLDAETPVFVRKLRGVLEPVKRERSSQPSPGPDEIVIRAVASGLNFRDVMYAMQMLPAEALEDGFTGATIGMELAGTVCAVGENVERLKIGNRVAAFASEGFASHVVAKEHATIEVPDEMSFAQAAGILTSFVTAYHGLVNCAQVKKGDLVFVQAGAGALGLASIQIAQLLGCRVVASAGSEVKQSILAALNVEYITQSRDGAFAADLQNRFGEHAFAAVLNSVSGAAIDDGISLLKPFGHFIEFGKRDFYENRLLPMKQLRRNITFHGVDADQLLRYEPSLSEEILTKLMRLFAEGSLQPILHQSADVSLLASVMQQMQASKHVGKLVLTHADAPASTAPLQPTNQDAAHGCKIPKSGGIAVIGGGSDFGLSLIETLAKLGCKKLFTITRSGVLSDELNARAASLMSQFDCEIQTLKADASNPKQLSTALDHIRVQAGALTGVVQAAMVLHDGFVAQSNLQKWQEVFAAKTKIDDAVDTLTAQDPIELNLIFSSATTIIGNPGQANYVAANRILEARTRARAAANKPALAIGWGAIGDAGYLSRNSAVRSVLEKTIGKKALSSSQAMSILERVLGDKTAPCVAYAMPADWGRVRGRLLSVKTRAFSPVVAYSAQQIAANDDFLTALKIASAEDGLIMLLTWLKEKLSGALRIEPDQLNEEKNLADLGLDSLLAVEFASTLEAGLQITIEVGQINPDENLAQLAQTLYDLVMGVRVLNSQESAIDTLKRQHTTD